MPLPDRLCSLVQNKFLYTISLNHFTTDSSTLLVSALFPVLLRIFSLSYTQTGMIVALGLVADVLLQALAGRNVRQGSSAEPSHGWNSNHLRVDSPIRLRQ